RFTWASSDGLRPSLRSRAQAVKCASDTGLRTKQEYVSLNAKELSMVAKVAITLTDDQQARLEQIAEARQESVVAMVEEAVAEYLDADAEYRKYVQEGLDDVAAGRVRDW